jgi:ankyrin repeat protein
MPLRQLLTQCCLGNEAEALEILRLNPGIINDPWDGAYFDGSGFRYVNRGDTAIMAASLGGSEGLVRELVGLGAEVNARNINNRDALMHASGHGHAAVVAALLDNGADPNTRDQNCSALGIAAAHDRLPVCQLLLG